MTCNPEWPEIKAAANLCPAGGNQTGWRTDLHSRVFKLKLDALLKDLRTDNVFGKHVGHIYVVEWQKRGLPHAHILLILSDNDAPMTPSHIDRIVSAELPPPDLNPELFDLVKKHNIHRCKASECEGGGLTRCNKNFPALYCDATETAADGYPLYRRKAPAVMSADDQRRYVHVARGTAHQGVFHATNAHVIPYSPYLTLKYQCHINVQICTSVRAVKYLYKYLFKGADRVTATVSTFGHGRFDEASAYLDSRYMCTSEAFWRIFSFAVRGSSHTVQRLIVHLEGQEWVTYRQDTVGEDVANESSSSLLAWLALNQEVYAARHGGVLHEATNCLCSRVSRGGVPCRAHGSHPGTLHGGCRHDSVQGSQFCAECGSTPGEVATQARVVKRLKEGGAKTGDVALEAAVALLVGLESLLPKAVGVNDKGKGSGGQEGGKSAKGDGKGPTVADEEEKVEAPPTAQSRRAATVAALEQDAYKFSRKQGYAEVAQKFILKKEHADDTVRWHPLKVKTKSRIGRMYWVDMAEGERFYLRLLLNKIPGQEARSFTHLRSFCQDADCQEEGHLDLGLHEQGFDVPGFPTSCRGAVEYSTFSAVVLARYPELLVHDQIHHDTLKQAHQEGLTALPLRSLFVLLLVHGDVCDKVRLWTVHKENLAGRTGGPNDESDDDVLRALEVLLLAVDGSCLGSHDLPTPPPADPADGLGGRRRDPAEVTEQRRDPAQQAALKEKVEKDIDLFTEEQSSAFTPIQEQLDAVEDGTVCGGNNFFVLDAPGGCGKTFLLSTLLDYVRSNGRMALATAYSGIAAQLLDGGRTSHYRFMFPKEPIEGCSCHYQADAYDDYDMSFDQRLTRRRARTRVLMEADLLVLDEYTMCASHYITAVDTMLQDLMQNDRPFGGKVRTLHFPASSS
jgi:hypothetical protein